MAETVLGKRKYSVANLEDVDLAGIQDGDTLVYDGADDTWKPAKEPVDVILNTTGTGDPVLSLVGNVFTQQSISATKPLSVSVGVGGMQFSMSGDTSHAGMLFVDSTGAVTTVQPGTSGVALVSTGPTSQPAFSTLGVAGGGSGLTTATQNAVLCGNGLLPFATVPPYATAGVALVSAGASALPQYATVAVTGGGTGTTAFNAYSLVVSGSTGTSALTSVNSATANKVLVSQGAAASPTFGTAPVTGGGTGVTSFTANGVVVAGATGTANLSSVSPGTLNQLLVSNGAASPPSFGTAPVGGGGTGATSFTENGVVVAGATSTSALSSVSPGTANQVLVSQGGSSSPAFGTAPVGGGGTGANSFSTNALVVSGSTGTSALTSLGSGTTNQILVSRGSGSTPNFTTAPVQGGGTGANSFTANGLVVAGATGTAALTSVAPGTANQTLISGGTGAAPTFGTAHVSGGGTGVGSFTPNALVASGATSTSGLTNVVDTTPGKVLVSGGTGVLASFGVAPVSGGGTGALSFTPYAVVTGNSGGTALQSVAVGASGDVLVSRGNSAAPSFGTAPVSGGGTGLSSLAAGAVLCGAGESVALVQKGTAAAGTPLVAASVAGDPPLFSTASVAGGGTGATTLTQYAVLCGNGASPVNPVSTSATAGVPLVSTGNSSMPTFSTTSVNGGGTGSTSFTPHGTIVAGATAHAALASVDPGTVGQALVSAGPNAPPAFGAVGVAAGGTGGGTFTPYTPICGGTTGGAPLQSVPPGSLGQVLVSQGDSALPQFGSMGIQGGGTGVGSFSPYSAVVSGATSTSPLQTATPDSAGQVLVSVSSAAPAFGTAPVSGGGTGLSSVTANGVLVGNTTSALAVVSPGSEGQALIAHGPGTAPTFASIGVPGGGTGAMSFTENLPVCGGTTGTAALQSVQPGTVGQPLMYTASNSLPSFGTLGVGGGGTGRGTLTPYAVLGAASTTTGAIYNISPGVAGQALISKGASAFPQFDSIGVAGGGTGLSSFTTNAIATGGTTSDSPLAFIPLTTAGKALVSTGVSSQPAFGSVGIAGGGTGTDTFAVNMPVCGGTTGTSQLQSVSAGTSTGQPLIYNTSGLPTFGTALVAGGGTGVTSLSTNMPICGGTTTTGNVQTVVAGTEGKLLVCHGAGSLPTFDTAPVTGGGTGTTSFTPNVPVCGGITSLGGLQSVVAGINGQPLVYDDTNLSYFGVAQVVGGGTGVNGFVANELICAGAASTDPVVNIPAGTQGQALVSNGAGAHPQFGSIQVPGGGTGKNSVTPYMPLCGGTDGTAALQSVATGTHPGQALLYTGANSIPQFSSIGIAGGGTGNSSFQPYEPVFGGTDVTQPLQQIGLGTAGQTMVSGGPGVLPTFGTLDVRGGGTGNTTFTQDALLVGNGLSAIGSIGLGTEGQVLVAHTGAAPSFGSMGVAGGGTGVNTLAVNSLIVGGSTGTGPVQSISGGAIGLPLVAQGPNVIPSFTGLGISGGGTGITSMTQNGVLCGQAAGGGTTVQCVAPGTEGQALIAHGANVPPTFASIGVLGGGTGVGTFTAYGVVCGGTTNTGGLQSVSPGTTGQALVSNGASQLPSFGSIGIAGGGTGTNALTAYMPVCGGTTGTSQMQSVVSGTSGFPLVSSGANAVPSFSALTVSGGGTGVTSLAVNMPLCAGTTGTGSLQTVVAGTEGQVLLSHGSNISTFGTAPVGGGGTGSITFTAYGVVCGGTTGTGSLQSVSPGTAGQVLVSNGNAQVPGFGSVGVGAGGTGATAVTAYMPVCGGTTGTSQMQSVVSGTVGYPLVSAGASAVPSFSALTVAGGGTGVTSLTINSLVVGGSTTTGALQSITGGSSGFPLVSQGPNVQPTFAVLEIAGGGTGITSMTQNGVLCGQAAGGGTDVQCVAPGTEGQTLIAHGTDLPPTFGTAPVAGGGTGADAFTAYMPVCGGTTGTSQMQSVVAGTSGFPLVSAGASAVPSFSALTVSGGGTGATTLQPYQPLFGGTTGTGLLQQVSLGSAGYALLSNGAGALPSFQALPSRAYATCSKTEAGSVAAAGLVLWDNASASAAYTSGGTWSLDGTKLTLAKAGVYNVTHLSFSGNPSLTFRVQVNGSDVMVQGNAGSVLVGRFYAASDGAELTVINAGASSVTMTGVDGDCYFALDLL